MDAKKVDLMYEDRILTRSLFYQMKCDLCGVVVVGDEPHLIENRGGGRYISLVHSIHEMAQRHRDGNCGLQAETENYGNEDQRQRDAAWKARYMSDRARRESYVRDGYNRTRAYSHSAEPVGVDPVQLNDFVNKMNEYLKRM